MCQSMVDIQPTAAEIRRGKKDRRKKKKIEITGQEYNGPPITQGGHNKLLLEFALTIAASCGIRPSARTISGVFSRRTRSLDTSASSALEAL